MIDVPLGMLTIMTTMHIHGKNPSKLLSWLLNMRYHMYDNQGNIFVSRLMDDYKVC